MSAADDARRVHDVTLRGDGESFVIKVPREMAERCGLTADTVAYAVETDLGILLTPGDTPFLDVWEADDRIIRQFENARRDPPKEPAA